MEYSRFEMCPFSVASIGGGMTISGIGQESYSWTHYPCLSRYCKMWTFKTDSQGKTYVEGCAMQLAGLTQEEIIKDLEIKESLKKESCGDCKFYFVSSFDNEYCKKTDNRTSKNSWCLKFRKRLQNTIE